MPAALTKVCSRCGEEKRVNQFYENRTKSDKRNGICKSCQKEVNNS